MYHPCQNGGACQCGGTCRRQNPYRRNIDENFRDLWRTYQQSNLRMDYNAALRTAQRSGMTTKCHQCKIPLVRDHEGIALRNWIFCADCYQMMVEGDEILCEGYEGECRDYGWVFHNQGRLESPNYLFHPSPTIFNVEDLWCDDCFRRALSDAEHEIAVNDYYAELD